MSIMSGKLPKLLLGTIFSMGVVHGMEGSKYIPKAMHKKSEKPNHLSEDQLYEMMIDKGYNVETLDNMKSLLKLDPSVDDSLIMNAWTRYKSRLHDQKSLENEIIKLKDDYKKYDITEPRHLWPKIFSHYNLDVKQFTMLLHPQNPILTEDSSFIPAVESALQKREIFEKTGNVFEASKGDSKTKEESYVPKSDSEKVRDAFKILGLNSHASLLDVEKTYKKLALKHHPDRGGDTETFAEISNAHDVLKAYFENK